MVNIYPDLIKFFNKDYKSAYRTGLYDTVQPNKSKEFLGYFLLSSPNDLTITVYESGLFGGHSIEKIKVNFPGEKRIVNF